MRYSVSFEPDVRREFRGLILGKDDRLRVLKAIREILEEHADLYRKFRDKSDPDLFVLDYHFLTDGRANVFTLWVNDTRDTTRLFVEQIAHSF